MNKFKGLFVLSIMVIALLLVGATCKQSSEKKPSVKQEPKKETKADIVISDFSFDPQDLTVENGQKVTWTNKDSAAHTVTSDNDDFDSGEISEGGNYSRIFSGKSGQIFKFYCTIHLDMTGQITVK